MRRVWIYPILVLMAFAGVYGFLRYRAETRKIQPPQPAPPIRADAGVTFAAAGAATSTATAEGDKVAEEGPRQAEPEKLVLKVPFVSESPEGSWKSPWINGCEEASISMAHFYFAGQEEVAAQEAKEYMQMLFAAEDAKWGSNANTDAARTVELINLATDMRAEIKEDPTIQDIKDEIRAGRPVITLHYGKTLDNPDIPFAVHGSYYHMIVTIGYDDATHEFIVNDDGDRKAGPGHRYGYTTFMQSLHDYDYADKRTDGPARAIFVEKK